MDCITLLKHLQYVADIRHLARGGGIEGAIDAARDVLAVVDYAVQARDVAILRTVNELCWRDFGPDWADAGHTTGVDFFDIAEYIYLIIDAIEVDARDWRDDFIAQYRVNIEDDLEQVAK